MTPDAFRQALTRLNLSQVAAAKALGISARSVRRYASGRRPIKTHIQLALERLEDKPQ